MHVAALPELAVFGWGLIHTGNSLPTNSEKPCRNAVAVSPRQTKVYARMRKTMGRSPSAYPTETIENPETFIA